MHDLNGGKKWWPLPDLNWGPTDYESGALTTELRGHFAGVRDSFAAAQVYPNPRQQKSAERRFFNQLDNLFAITRLRSSSTARCGLDGAVYVTLLLQFGESAHGLHQTAYLLLLECDRYSYRYRNASVILLLRGL